VAHPGTFALRPGRLQLRVGVLREPGHRGRAAAGFPDARDEVRQPLVTRLAISLTHLRACEIFMHEIHLDAPNRQ
ncbi:MAG: hypothetical protein ACRDWG_18475, partial [Actinomycetes bacterium]